MNKNDDFFDPVTGKSIPDLDILNVKDDNIRRIKKLENVLIRCKTILTNMAAENEGTLNQIFNRWKINHEPLRNDAKNILRTIDEILYK